VKYVVIYDKLFAVATYGGNKKSLSQSAEKGNRGCGSVKKLVKEVICNLLSTCNLLTLSVSNVFYFIFCPVLT